jgi:hypothetical protein
MIDTPAAAFAWLIEQFERYTRNEITWLEVRAVLAEATDLRERFAHRDLDPQARNR